MANSRILLLADDLTGALEVGSKFAAAGIPSLVTTRFDALPQELETIPAAFVVDTESRHLPAAEAAGRVYELALAAREAAFSFVYKKTDSTLRGNIGAELSALVEAYAGAPLLYAPAYPQLGRTVHNGSLMVDRRPVAGTAFAKDPFHPVRESHIPTLLAAQCRLPILSRQARDLGDAPRWSISVCDGETDADLKATAKALLGCDTFHLAAGSAGFVHHFARLAGLPRGSSPSLPFAKNVLVVNGSLHQLSLRQIAAAKQEGFGSFDAGSISAVPADGGWIILDQECGTPLATPDFARNAAKNVCQVLKRIRPDALVVFGGDTAFAIVEAMGNPPLHPIGEAMEGVPVSRIDAKHVPGGGDLLLVTKAGGFGPHDVLATLRRSLGES